MKITDWQTVADGLATDCSSESIRNATIAILQKVELIGPLLTHERTAFGEFRRVYHFLTYNEPARVMAVVNEQLATFQRSGNKSLAKYNAWNYVVGAFDLWLSRARVFYTATGLVEGALRARLDARMTDTYGSTWPQEVENIPSPIRPLAAGGSPEERLGTIRRLLADQPSGDEKSAAGLLDAVQKVLVTEAGPICNGSQLVSELDFGGLRMFFQAKRLWNRGPGLGHLFRNPATGQPPLRSEVDEALRIVHEVRNEVAHYRRPTRIIDSPAQSSQENPIPVKLPPSFTKGFYALSQLASWMGVDLQHFYSAVDTRHTPELSLLLEDPILLARMAPKVRICAGSICQIGEPLDMLLTRAPVDGRGLDTGNGLFACLYHRVSLRATVHRPAGE